MTQNPVQQRRNRILAWIINLAGVLAFGLVLYVGGVEAWQQIAQADWRYVLAAFGVTLLWNLVAAYRWAVIAGQVIDEALPCPFRYYFVFHMIGMTTGQVVPITVGMLGGRPVALSLSREVSLKRAGLSVLLDKLFDLILALVVAGPVVLYLAGVIGLTLAFALIGLLLVFSVLLLGWQYEQGARVAGRASSRLAQPLTRLPVVGRRLIRRLPEQLNRLAGETFLTNSAAVRAFLLTLVMYSLLAARLYFIALALRLDIPWYLMVMGVGVTQLTLIFSVTPGSLGFLEAGWGAVLGLAGLGKDPIVLFLIARRAFLLVFILIQTLLAFGWIRESPARLFRAVLKASRQPAADQNGNPSAAVK
jgi:uncharacterized protein (TIRG00374 family)